MIQTLVLIVVSLLFEKITFLDVLVNYSDFYEYQFST